MTPYGREPDGLLDRLRAIHPYVYVASPYSKHPGGMEAAFREVCQAAGWLLQNGVRIFCPIAHSHPIAVHAHLPPADHDLWLPADRPLMHEAGGMVVVMLESWRESYGISVEIEAFEEMDKPVYFLQWPRRDT